MRMSVDPNTHLINFLFLISYIELSQQTMLVEEATMQAAITMATME